MPIAQFSGLASGIDSAALIDATIEAREAPNRIREQEVQDLEAENDSLDEFNTKLIALNDLVDAFRTSNGGGVNKRANSSDGTVASATASSSATNTTTTLTVNSVAKAATASFDDTFTSLSDPLAANATGTQTIGVDFGSTPTSIDVDITSATTISEYVENFNQTSGAEGNVVAAIVNVGTTDTPSYKVVFNTLNTGTEDGEIAFDIPDAATGFGGNSDLQNRTIDQATNAEFSIDGIAGTITRESNSINDVIAGVSFTLSSTGSAEITVSDDASATADDVREIVDAFNDIVEFVNENDVVERVEAGENVDNIFGSLAKTRVDDDFLAAFRSELSSTTSDTGTLITSFSQVGISTNRDGTLAFDSDRFEQAVTEESTSVTELLNNFADDTAGIAGFINQYTRIEGFIDIAQGGNNSEIQLLNDEIDELDRFNEGLRASLEKQFASLESRVGQLQSQQSALSGILAGLPG